MTDGIPFRRDMSVTYGQLDDVADGLRRIHARNPSPFTFHGTGTYVVGRGEVAVIDPGPADPAHVEALIVALAARGERIGHILVTHSHRDHSPAAALLKAATGAPIHGFSPRPGSPEPVLATAALDEGRDDGFTPDIPLTDGDEIKGEGFHLTALHTPGHISDHLCFAWAETGALFTGDHVMGWSTSVVVPPDGHMGDYLESLEKVAARDDLILYPTHGPAIDDPAPFLASYIAHRRARERQILCALEQNPTTIPALVERLYATLDPRLRPAAAMSVLSHLIHLREQGLVTVGEERKIDAVWRHLC